PVARAESVGPVVRREAGGLGSRSRRSEPKWWPSWRRQRSTSWVALSPAEKPILWMSLIRKRTRGRRDPHYQRVLRSITLRSRSWPIGSMSPAAILAPLLFRPARHGSSTAHGCRRLTSPLPGAPQRRRRSAAAFTWPEASTTAGRLQIFPPTTQ